MIAIYLLRDPITKRPRYVGLSREPEKRYQFHKWGKGKGNPHLKNWVAKLRRVGEVPIMEIIYNADTDQLASTMERYFIRVYRSDFPDLINLTSGGESSYIVSDEVKERISATMKTVMTPEHRQHLSDKLKGRPNPNPKGFVPLNIARRGIPLSAETRRKISEANKGRTQSEENKKKLSQRSKKKWEDPSYRKWMSETNKPILDAYREIALAKARELKTVKKEASKDKVRAALAKGLKTTKEIVAEVGYSKTYVLELLNCIKQEAVL